MGMPAVGAAAEPLYKISLAEWSMNKSLFGGQMQHLDFAKIAKRVGIDAIEYVNQFFKDKAKDAAYPQGDEEARRGRRRDPGADHVRRRRALGDPDDAKRQTAVENHYKWVEAAKFLGCHSIRVNGDSDRHVRRADEARRRRPAQARASSATGTGST